MGVDLLGEGGGGGGEGLLCKEKLLLNKFAFVLVASQEDIFVMH
jgi:hypothetical protein